MKNSISQPKKFSLLEALSNVAIGFVIGVASNELILPLFGFHPSFWDNFNMAILYTAVSIVRSYLLRRAFNWYHIKIYE